MGAGPWLGPFATHTISSTSLADALSTALYLLPVEDGQKLLDEFGVEAMWIPEEGDCVYSPGFARYIKGQ